MADPLPVNVTFTFTPTNVNIIVQPLRRHVPSGTQTINWNLSGTPGAAFATDQPISFYPDPPWPYPNVTRVSDTQCTVTYNNDVTVQTIYGYNVAINYSGTIYNVDPEVGNDPPVGQGGGQGGDHGGGDQGQDGGKKG
jgi:hypothetical protein